MPASKERQLNIRSSEAFDRAASLARRLGTTTTRVVEDALRAYDERTARRDELGLTPEARRRYDALIMAVEELEAHIPPGTTFDQAALYDDDGLPK
ncbi:MAG: type II toxin-antitoxin system VapB family antitoxin [Methylobacteriaceae bacterium]|nr:type II toxin-antitoxin system VapB family antitoxin [Methylobacteriaceae bacterium]